MKEALKQYCLSFRAVQLCWVATKKREKLIEAHRLECDNLAPLITKAFGQHATASACQRGIPLHAVLQTVSKKVEIINPLLKSHFQKQYFSISFIKHLIRPKNSFQNTINQWLYRFQLETVKNAKYQKFKRQVFFKQEAREQDKRLNTFGKECITVFRGHQVR